MKTESEMPDWIKEAMERESEPLDEELEPFLCEAGSLGQSLKHPLVFQVPFFPALAYRVNDQLVAKKDALRLAMSDKSWHTVVWLHERPYRAEAFENIAPLITVDSLYWELLGDVYTDTENFWQESERWKRLLTANRGSKGSFMTDEDFTALSDMPYEITVYRGFNGRGKKRSWAWTTNRDKAVWFAQRLNREDFGKPPTLVTGKLERRHAIGYLTRRGEDEIVVDPKWVTVTKTETVL